MNIVWLINELIYSLINLFIFTNSFTHSVIVHNCLSFTETWRVGVHGVARVDPNWHLLSSGARPSCQFITGLTYRNKQPMTPIGNLEISNLIWIFWTVWGSWSTQREPTQQKDHKEVDINSVNQPRASQSRYVRVHIKFK